MEKKALFITVVDIYDKNGNGGVKGSQRNFKLVQRYFGEQNVILVTFPRKEYTNPPEGAIFFERTQNNFQHLIAALFGCKVYFPWNEKIIENYIKEQNIDLLFIDSSMLGRLAKIKGDFKKIVFFHNVEAEYALNKVKNEGRKYLPSYWASKKNEKLAMKYADSVICLNKRDLNDLFILYNRKADFILPVTLEDSFDVKRCENTLIEKNKILFVGAYMPLNIFSIEWFIENVMSFIPEITLDIVGKGFEKKRKEYKKYNNVNVIGEVDDLGDYYYNHEIVVLPIQYGAGMKIKTAEAMMYGRKIVASDEALEGYVFCPDSDIYRCNKPEEYINSILKIIKSDNREKYSKRVRRAFLNCYETGIIFSRFSSYITKLLQ